MYFSPSKTSKPRFCPSFAPSFWPQLLYAGQGKPEMYKSEALVLEKFLSKISCSKAFFSVDKPNDLWTACARTRFVPSISLPPTNSMFSEVNPRKAKAISSEERPAQSAKMRSFPDGIAWDGSLSLCCFTKPRSLSICFSTNWCESCCVFVGFGCSRLQRRSFSEAVGMARRVRLTEIIWIYCVWHMWEAWTCQSENAHEHLKALLLITVILCNRISKNMSYFRGERLRIHRAQHGLSFAAEMSKISPRRG